MILILCFLCTQNSQGLIFFNLVLVKMHLIFGLLSMFYVIGPQNLSLNGILRKTVEKKANDIFLG